MRLSTRELEVELPLGRGLRSVEEGPDELAECRRVRNRFDIVDGEGESLLRAVRRSVAPLGVEGPSALC